MESLEWLEIRTTLSLILSTAWCWQQVARQLHLVDSWAMVVFLLQHYDKTCTTPMPRTSFCSACGSPRDQFCASCFPLAPKLHQQADSSPSAGYGTGRSEASHSHAGLRSNLGGQSSNRVGSENSLEGPADAEETAAASESFDNHAADFDDATDDEYYTRETVKTRTDRRRKRVRAGA
ncbi:uncharacterized protein LOC143301376 [Babylonia areolata]|uniref:uncharacterized protein LOC143301376 n=1 Tax=Babylonia areolata TaxID=304850 RepID=UPI003FD3F599